MCTLISYLIKDVDAQTVESADRSDQIRSDGQISTVKYNSAGFYFPAVTSVFVCGANETAPLPYCGGKWNCSFNDRRKTQCFF